MDIAVVGGGINGLCVAWQLAEAGHKVSLYERDQLMGATSSASSKLLHGGLRYLEQGHWQLVKTGLAERRWWLDNVPQLTQSLPLIYPLYQQGRRRRWQLKLGLTLYDALAGRQGLGRHQWLSREAVLHQVPNLRSRGLLGGYLFLDGQMDDKALGLWVAEQCRLAGVQIFEQHPVLALDAKGTVALADGLAQFDAVINVAGPWSQALLQQSGLAVEQPLDLVRGSHLLLPGQRSCGLMLEVPGEARLVFLLPYGGQSLLGTTEVRHELGQPIQCSEAETRYLLNCYNHYLMPSLTEGDVVASFAGVRPLLAGSLDPSKASRDFQLSRQGRVLTVSGGKWTTARALARTLVAKLGDES